MFDRLVGMDDGEVNGSGTGDAPVPARLMTLADLLKATATVEDDGSLRARLWDLPGVADAMLGRSPLHPYDAGSDGDGHGEAVAALLDISGPVDVDDLGVTIEAIGEVFRRVNRLEAWAAVLVERARVQGLRAKTLLDFGDPNVARAPEPRRDELARRTVVAEIALETRQTETAVSQRVTESQALVARAPRTLAAALEGKVGWRNAAKVAEAVGDLDETTAARLDAGVAGPACRQNPTQFARTVRRVRERVHATPPEVRHQDAATKRFVSIAPSVGGMAYLTLFAPAPVIHAAHDRLTQAARSTRSAGDARTLDQLRADVMTALLLDDGTLDLTACTTTAASDPADTDRGPGRVSAPNVADPATEATAADPDRTFLSSCAERSGVAGSSPVSSDAPGSCDCGRCAPSAQDDKKGGHSGRGGHGGHALDDKKADPDPPGPGTSDRSTTDELWEDRYSLARIARSLRPKIYVTVPVLTLLGRIDEPGLLDGTVPIDADTAREMAGLATSFTRLLTHPHTGDVLAVGSEAYRPPADLTQYVTARDNGCRFPGCTRRAVETDTDHTTAHATGGATDATNLAALCRRHHVLKHQASYTVTQSETGDGTLTWTTPTGRTHTTSPDGIPATIHREKPTFSPMSDDPDDTADDLGDPPF